MAALGWPVGSSLSPPAPASAWGDVRPGRLAALQAQWGVAPAEQLDARHRRRDRRDVDVIVAVAAALPLL
jgi:hypothetical protein